MIGKNRANFSKNTYFIAIIIFGYVKIINGVGSKLLFQVHLAIRCHYGIGV